MWRKRHMFHSEILCIALPKASNTPSSYKMHFFIIFYYISFRSQVFNQSLNHLFIKKNWKTNLHIMQPMCHIPICLPSSQSSLLTSLLNCSQSVSHLMLLIILVACSWFFSSSMLSFFFLCGRNTCRITDALQTYTAVSWGSPVLFSVPFLMLLNIWSPLHLLL